MLSDIRFQYWHFKIEWYQSNVSVRAFVTTCTVHQQITYTTFSHLFHVKCCLTALSLGACTSFLYRPTQSRPVELKMYSLLHSKFIAAHCIYYCNAFRDPHLISRCMPSGYCGNPCGEWSGRQFSINNSPLLSY